MFTWKRNKVDDVPIYTATSGYDDFEIRSWPYDESGEGRFQLCHNGYNAGNFKTLKEAKSFVEEGYRWT